MEVTNKSADISLLSAALVAFQQEVSVVPRGSINPFFKSKYADFADVKATATPVAAKHGLAVSQFPITVGDADGLSTILMHASGQFIESTAFLHLVKIDPQAHGSAITYLKRYAYMSCLGLVADEDDDGNKGSQRDGGQVNRQQRPAPQQSPPREEFDIEDPRLIVILQAENQGNDFINDLCAKYRQYGNLSEKQLDSGARAASKPTRPRQAPVANEPFTPPGGWDEEEKF